MGASPNTKELLIENVMGTVDEIEDVVQKGRPSRVKEYLNEISIGVTREKKRRGFRTTTMTEITLAEGEQSLKLVFPPNDQCRVVGKWGRDTVTRKVDQNACRVLNDAVAKMDT